MATSHELYQVCHLVWMTNDHCKDVLMCPTVASTIVLSFENGGRFGTICGTESRLFGSRMRDH